MTQNQSPSKLKIIPLGGLGEIGLNCMLFEYEDEILVVDCGVMFSDMQMLGVEFLIPDFTYLKDNASKVSGYIITHGHEDHIGALPFALKDCPAPVYSTLFAQKLIHSKLEEYGLQNSTEFKTFNPHENFKFKHFKIKAVPVNHSIIEAMALFIETPVGKIIFTGDFKIDANPYYGKPMEVAPFKEAGDEGLLLLMSDSTNVERDGHSTSEEKIFHKFEEIFSKAKGLTIVSVFASNIARIGQVIDVCHKLGKKVALMGRSMEQNTRIAHDIGYLENLHSVLISLDQISNYERKNCVVLSTGSQGEYRSGLVRIANKEHSKIKIGEGDLIVLSSKFIPGNEKAIGRMINSLFKLGADVLYESVADIHVSGHANAGELRAMMNLTRPQFFIPVHGEYRHLVKHARLANENGIPKENTLIAVNGDVLELTSNSLQLVDHFEENRILIEGHGGTDVSPIILRERRKVAEAGIIFAILIRLASNQKILAGPDLITRGYMEEGSDENAKLIEKAKKHVVSILKRVQQDSKSKSIDLQEEIRIGLRRFLQTKTGKRPVVMPIIIDI